MNTLYFQGGVITRGGFRNPLAHPLVSARVITGGSVILKMFPANVCFWIDGGHVAAVDCLYHTPPWLTYGRHMSATGFGKTSRFW